MNLWLLLDPRPARDVPVLTTVPRYLTSSSSASRRTHTRPISCTIFFSPVGICAESRTYFSPEGTQQPVARHGSAGNTFEISRVPFRGRHTPSARTCASSPARRRSRAPRKQRAEAALVEERRLQRRVNEQTTCNSALPKARAQQRGARKKCLIALCVKVLS